MDALPPGPRNALWQTVRYLRNPMGLVLRLAARYGDPFTLPTLVRPVVVSGAPEHIRAIFSADPETFTPFSVDAMRPILGQGSVLLQHGAPHRRARKLMQPPFHGARMRSYGAAMRETALAHLQAMPVGRPVAIEEVFRAISLDVILRTIFGVAGGERIDRARASVLASIGAFGPLLAMFSFLRRELGGVGPWARFRRRLGEVHDLLRREIAARREGTPGEDVLSLLVAARDEDGAPMDDQEVVEQLFTMVVAGHETTATTLAWAVDELYRDPAQLGPLRDELRDGDGDADRLAAAPRVDAVCAEALRMHPIVPVVSRTLVRPLALGDHTLPAGVGVGACLVTAHRREAVFPEPLAFRPERFLGGRAFTPYEYLPWGGGARRCLGASFAMHEMKIVLGTMVRTIDIDLVDPPAFTAARPATLGPKGGVRVIRRA